VQRRDNLSAVTGACFITTRVIWRKLGGFSEAYGTGTCEDVEFCLGVKRVLGKKIVVDPAAQGTHVVGASSATQNKPFALRDNLKLLQLRMRQFILHDEYLLW
jgi:GT2 family glycosyltransferase